MVRDYIKIEYQGGSNLYILATQLDSLQKYSGGDASNTPKLNKLGTSEWNKTKSKVGCCKKYRKGTGGAMRPARRRKGMCVARILCGRESLRRCSL